MIRFKITKNKNNIAFLAVFFVIIFLISNSPTLIKAQSTDTSGYDNTPVPEQIKEIKQQLDVNVSPVSPKPGDDVTITAETYGMDLNSTDIQWLVNGKVMLRGNGAKKFVFNVGKSGVSRVLLNIYPQNQPQISREFVFNPSNVDLLWQAETYTPPFYKGKALFSNESAVTMVAIPNFVNGNSRVSDSNAVYKWSVDREVQGDNSGYGKNSFSYTSDILSQDSTIDVEAYPSGDENRKGVGSVNLSTKNAFVLFYEDNPTNGIMFNYSLTDQINLGSRNEAKVSIFPYNFSTANKSSGLEYTWYINSQLVNIPLTTNSVTIKRNDQQEVDTANVSINVSNPTHITQSTQNAIDFLFGKTK